MTFARTIRQAATTLVLVSLIFLAVFGLPMLWHMGGMMGCPFEHGGMSMCDAVVKHIDHWRAAVTGIAAQVLMLIVFLLVAIAWPLPRIADIGAYRRIRLRVRMPMRVSLVQELLSQGIVNRKEPHFA